MAERIIPFPFQKKQIEGVGEKAPLNVRVLEESKTLDKWQVAIGVPVAIVFPAAGALMIGASVVSHEVARGELQKIQAKGVKQETDLAIAS